MSSPHRSGRLAVHEYGDPEAMVLLLLHGLTDSGRCWTDLVERLGPAYRIVAPDALGHGASDRFTPEELSGDDPIEHMYAALPPLLREIAPPGGALVMGHSMGGGLAAALAAREPELVRAVVLEDPVWMEVPSRADREAETRQRVVDAELATADPSAAIARCREEHPSWPASELPPWAAAKAEVDKTFLGSGRAVLATPWQQIATAIRPPTLLVTGGRDVIVHSRVRDEITRLENPALELHVVDDAAHCVRRDRGDAFHAAVDPWLARQT